MSNQVVSNINIPRLDNRNPVTFSQNGQSPAMQGISAEQVKEGVDQVRQGVDNSYLANRVNASKEADPRAVLATTAGAWYLINQGMDRVNLNSSKPYEQTTYGKLTKWGDKFIQNTWVGRKIDKGIRIADAAFYKLSKKSKIVYSLRNHITKPEWGFAKVPGAGIHGFLAQDVEHAFEEFLKPIANKSEMMGLNHSNAFQKLEQYGMSQKDIEAFVKSVDGKPFAEKALALQRKELELLGADSTVISRVYSKKGLDGLQKYAKILKVRALGFKSVREFESLKGKFLENPKKIMEVLEKAVAKNPNLKISIWRKNGQLGAVQNHFFGRTVSVTEYLNKYKANFGTVAKTRLGKFLPKALGFLQEGCTNRFAGGKLGVLMQAYIFGDMLVNTFNAPKGEKGKTLIERFVNDFTYFIGMPLSMFLMHKVGGFKFAGLDEQGKIAYQKALADLNAKNKSGGFASKKEYKQAVKDLNAKLGLKNIKNPITKLLSKAGRIINMGNERILPYKSTSKYNMNFLRVLKNSNILGVPIRAIMVLGVLSPFLAKVTTKAAHKIFGRPTHSVLDEEKEEQPQQNQDVAFQGQKPVPPAAPVDPNKLADSNLIKQTLNRTTPQNGAQTPGSTAVPTSPAATAAGTTPGANPQPQVQPQPQPQPSTQQQPQPEKDKTPVEPPRTYIPSPQGVVLPEEDTSAADMALARADAAERKILDALKTVR